MTKFSRLSMLTTGMALVAIIALSGAQITSAQGPRPGRPSINVQAFNACTTTDYAAIASKALGITAADLRKDIVGGQTLQQIATSANIDFQTVSDAIQTARKAEIDQAVTDGVITQDEGTTLETPVVAATQPAGNAPTPDGTRPARPQGGPAGVQFPDISTIRFLLAQLAGTQSGPGNGFGGGGGFGAGMFNLVKPYAVVGQVVKMKCTDVVKTLITPPGESMVALAANQKVDAAALSDGLMKAYIDALAQDVTDGVITQAQSDQLGASLGKEIQTFINNPLPMGQQATPAK